MARSLLVINPASRRARRHSFCSRLLRELSGLSPGFEVVVSSSASQPASLARQAVQLGYEMVVAVGGDGLVSQIAAELVGSRTVLGIIPAGAGNDFARGLGIPLGLKGALRVLAQGGVRWVDVGQACRRHFFSVAVTGFAAEVNRRANRLSRLSLPQIYTLTTLATVFSYRPRHFALSLEGKERHYYGWMVAVGNTWSCAAGMALLPAACPDDGLLDICVVQGINRVQLLLAFPRVFLGSHVYHKGVASLRAREVTLNADPPCEVYADGERLGTLPLTLSVWPRALGVRVPL